MNKEVAKQYLARQIDSLVSSLLDSDTGSRLAALGKDESVSEILYNYRLLMDMQITDFTREDAEKLAQTIIQTAEQQTKVIPHKISFTTQEVTGWVMNIHQDDLDRTEINSVDLVTDLKDAHE